MIFYITDLIFLASFLPIQLYFGYQNIAYERYTLGLFSVFIIGIVGGINLIQVMMYLRLKYSDYALSFVSLFIPFQFAIGSILNAYQNVNYSNAIMGLSYMTGARILLISIIPNKNLSQNVKQMEETQQIQLTTDIQNNQIEDEAGNDKYLQAFLKNFKYLIIVIIFQTSSMPFQYHPTQLFIVLFHMIFFDLINKNRMIILGQISVCFGYCMNATVFSVSGYYLGLGTLFYPIICKISTSELIIISEISWIIRLSTMCFIAVMQKISYNLFLLDSEVQNNVFFILNFVSLILLQSQELMIFFINYLIQFNYNFITILFQKARKNQSSGRKHREHLRTLKYINR